MYPIPGKQNDNDIESLNGNFEDATLSPYQPKDDVKELTMSGHKDMIHGDMLLSRPFREFNEKSLIQRASLDQQDWLAWSPPPSDNPDEDWMFTGTSNATRNNIISMAAHVAQRIVFPSVVAVNQDDQEDTEAAYVARGLLEYNFRSHQYSQTFIYAIISGMVNPVTYYKCDYVRAYMDILEGTNSEYTKKTVIDDALSGFQHHLLPCEEVLISNPYCFDIERQKCLIHRRRISYAEAQQYFGSHPNFQHVMPGTLPQYNASDALFYSMRDPILDGLVEVATYYYRSIDVEYTEINRIYVGGPNPDYNPFKHRTNRNKPEYNISKFGAEPIDAKRFWAYKSIAAKLSNDKELVDRMRQNAVDASTLSTFPPAVTMGAGKLDQGVLKPATVTDINRDAKIDFLKTANPQAAYNAAKAALDDIGSAANPSYFEMPSGQGRMTQYQMQLLQQNAMANLLIIGTMIGNMVTDIGRIVLNDSLRFQTVAEIGEIVNGIPSLSYKSYNVPRVKDGKSVTDKIIFTDAWMGREMTDGEKDSALMGLLEKHGEDSHVWEVNPGPFLDRDYMVRVEPDQLMPQDQATEAKKKSDLYDKAIANPLIAQNPKSLADVTRDFLFEPVVHGDASKYIPDQSTAKVANAAIPGTVPGQGGVPPMQMPGRNGKPQLSTAGGAPSAPQGV